MISRLDQDPNTRPYDQLLSETLPFDNYRATTAANGHHTYGHNHQLANRNTTTYAGANRLSDNEDEHADDEQEQQHANGHENNNNNSYPHHYSDGQDSKKRDNGHNYGPSNLIAETLTRNMPSSSFIDTSVRSSPNTSTLLMMMKGNEAEAITHQPVSTSRNGIPAYEHRTVVVSSSIRPNSSGSSSSSSSLPVDEQQQQQLRARGYNFVPAPFNGTRLVAKSTEQLNRSFANDSLVKYCTPPTTPTSALIQSANKAQSPTSILKQNYLQKYTQPLNSSE